MYVFKHLINLVILKKNAYKILMIKLRATLHLIGTEVREVLLVVIAVVVYSSKVKGNFVPWIRFFIFKHLIQAKCAG